MTLLPHQAFVALKRELAARGKRAPPELSIVDGFCRQPSPVYGADSAGPAACPLVLAAARASPAALRQDAQNDNRRATTRDWPTGAETAEPSPRFDEPTKLFHAGWSDSPAR